LIGWALPNSDAPPLRRMRSVDFFEINACTMHAICILGDKRKKLAGSELLALRYAASATRYQYRLKLLLFGLRDGLAGNFATEQVTCHLRGVRCLLPGELCAAEVTVCRGCLVDRAK
jgi:hypothetical protein